MAEALLTVGEAAQRLKMHPETLRRLLRRGQIKAIKRGPRLWRIPESALIEPAPTAPAPHAQSEKNSPQPMTAQTTPLTASAGGIYPAPFSDVAQSDAPDLSALFTPQTPEEIARRLAAINSISPGIDTEAQPQSDDDPSAGVKATYGDRLARLMEASR